MVVIQCDEHIPFSVVKGLRARGIEVFNINDANLMGVSDEELFIFCLERKRVILTNDSDFLDLAKQKSHNVIIYLTSQYIPIGKLIRETLKIIDNLGGGLKDSIFYIS